MKRPIVTGIPLVKRLTGVKCDGNNPCARCVKVIGKARTYLEPCYREDLGSISLVRRGKQDPVNMFPHADVE